MSNLNSKYSKTIQKKLKEMGHAEIPLGHCYEVLAALKNFKSWNIAKTKEEAEEDRNWENCDGSSGRDNDGPWDDDCDRECHHWCDAEGRGIAEGQSYQATLDKRTAKVLVMAIDFIYEQVQKKKPTVRVERLLNKLEEETRWKGTSSNLWISICKEFGVGGRYEHENPVTPASTIIRPAKLLETIPALKQERQRIEEAERERDRQHKEAWALKKKLQGEWDRKRAEFILTFLKEKYPQHSWEIQSRTPTRSYRLDGDNNDELIVTCSVCRKSESVHGDYQRDEVTHTRFWGCTSYLNPCTPHREIVDPDTLLAYCP